MGVSLTHTPRGSPVYTDTAFLLKYARGLVFDLRVTVSFTCKIQIYLLTL